MNASISAFANKSRAALVPASSSGVLLSLVLASGLAATRASAQPKSDPDTQVARTPAAAPVRFSDEPLRLETVGLTLGVPVGTQTQKTSMSDVAGAQIAARDGSWLIDIRTPRTGTPTTTPLEAAKAVMEQLMAEAGVVFVEGEAQGVRGRILQEARELEIAGAPPAARFYVETFQEAGRDGARPALVRGYTVFKISGDRFVTIELRTTAPEFAQARTIYETTIATASFEDVASQMAERKVLIDAGLALLDRADEALFRQIVSERPERWYRLYLPGSDGTEIGYQRVKLSIEPRGVLDAGAKRADWTSEDKVEGVVVRLNGRALEGDNIVDWESAMFVAFDASSESWTTRNGVRPRNGKKKDTVVSTEVGVRDDAQLIVKVTVGGKTNTIKPIPPSNWTRSGYISRATAFLLPHLMAKLNVPGEYAFYSFQPDAGTIRIRTDSLTEPRDKPGALVLKTRLSEERVPQTTILNERGDLIRTELPSPDGRSLLWEPVEFDRLVKLWKLNGLPMD